MAIPSIPSLPPADNPLSTVSRVHTRASQPDPFAGLKGHEYLRARGLNQPVQRVQTSAQVTPVTAVRVK